MTRGAGPAEYISLSNNDDDDDEHAATETAMEEEEEEEEEEETQGPSQVCASTVYSCHLLI